MNALAFLYKHVLNHVLQGSIDAVRAAKKITAPVVIIREEVAAVLSLTDGAVQVVAKLLYGSGLRIREAVRLRVKDIDYQMKQLTVYAIPGKGCSTTHALPIHVLCCLLAYSLYNSLIA